jgi:hypothetical protein
MCRGESNDTVLIFLCRGRLPTWPSMYQNEHVRCHGKGEEVTWDGDNTRQSVFLRFDQVSKNRALTPAWDLPGLPMKGAEK